MQLVKNPPANVGDVRDAGSLPGSGRPPGGEMAAHSSVLAWRTPRTEEAAAGPQSTGEQIVGHG